MYVDTIDEIPKTKMLDILFAVKKPKRKLSFTCH